MYFTTAGPANQLELLLRARIDRASELSARRDRGASAVEWVIITAVLIAIVVAVGGIILTKLRTAANALDPQPNVGAP